MLLMGRFWETLSFENEQKKGELLLVLLFFAIFSFVNMSNVAHALSLNEKFPQFDIILQIIYTFPYNNLINKE